MPPAEKGAKAVDREDRIEYFRGEINRRTPDISRLPEGHPTREALLAECADYTSEIRFLKDRPPSAVGPRIIGTVLAATGIAGLVTLDGGWYWGALALAALGVLTIIGA